MTASASAMTDVLPREFEVGSRLAGKAERLFREVVAVHLLGAPTDAGGELVEALVLPEAVTEGVGSVEHPGRSLEIEGEGDGFDS